LSLQKDSLIKQRLPWITFDAINYLEGIDLSDKRIFEYGSGGSTLFWLSRGAQCVSIEHDLDWFNKIKRVTSTYSFDYRLILPEPDTRSATDPANPDDYSSDEFNYHKVNYKNYASQIDEFPSNYFDVVLIDGRSRPACIKHSAIKVKKHGLLILDNSDRDYYLSKTSQYLSSFTRMDFRGIVPSMPMHSTTTIFRYQ